ncbi:MAG: hypothetical protein DMF42_05895 [Verrucomicrobia bacterium]|nr:MAG: hypothetical protein DMF42_05895 [Verrucomicrobiota bacterium]
MPDKCHFKTGIDAFCAIPVAFASLARGKIGRIRKPPLYPSNYGNNGISDPFDSLCSLGTSF